MEDIRNTRNPITPLTLAEQQRLYSRQLDRQYEQLMKSFSPQEQKGLSGLHEAIEAVHNAKSQTELEKALDSVRDQASKLEHSKTVKELKQKLHRKAIKERTSIYYEQEDVEANMPGMTRFWDRLGDVD